MKIEGFGGRPPFGGRPGALGPLNPALVKLVYSHRNDRLSCMKVVESK